MDNRADFAFHREVPPRVKAARSHPALAFGLGLLSLGMAETGNASGFRVPPETAAGLGVAHAISADPFDTGAVPYNASVVAFHEGWIAGGAITAIDRTIRVTNAAGTSTSDARQPTWVPNNFGEGPLAGDVRWAVTFDAPFGQETNWRAGTFPGFAGSIAGLAPTRTRIQVLGLHPTFAWRAAPSIGLGAGVDYYDVREADLDTASVRVHGHGNAAGWQLSLIVDDEPWSLGLAYHSSVNIPIHGEIATSAASAGARTHLRLPERAQAGARYASTPRIEAEFDVEWTRWSQFGTLAIEHDLVGLPRITSIGDARDTLAYRFGLTYALQPGIKLRLGYAQDQYANRASHVSARGVDLDSRGFSVGLGYTRGDWTFDVAYAYVDYRDRSFDNRAPFGTYGLDPGGTSLFNGTYSSHAHSLALGITRRF